MTNFLFENSVRKNYVRTFFSGDDKLQLEELERVMGECLRESGLELPEIDVQVNKPDPALNHRL
jgi:hypothetical protein